MSKRQRRDDDYSDEERRSEERDRKYEKDDSDSYSGKRRGYDENDESKEEKDKRTIFVGKLSDECDEDKLRKIFKQYGNVEDIRFLYRDRERRYHKGCAFIQFEKPTEAQDALKENEVVHMDQALRVNMASDKGDNLSIFVGNLSFDTTEDTLQSTFEKFGKVTKVYMPLNESGRSKGFAFVTYENKESQEAATKLNRTELDKREIRVEIGSRKKQDRRGGYDRDRRGGYDRDRRGGYDRDRRGGYDRDRRDDYRSSRDYRDDYRSRDRDDYRRDRY
eukprot:gene3932-7142_t